MEELTPYQRWQLEKYGEILPEPQEDVEPGEAAERRFVEWIEINNYLQMHQYEY